LVQVFQPLHLFYMTTLTQVRLPQHRFRVRQATAFGWLLLFFVSGLPTPSLAKE
jgi:hypothetical protein